MAAMIVQWEAVTFTRHPEQAFRQKRVKDLAGKGQTVAVQPDISHHPDIDPSTVAPQRVSG